MTHALARWRDHFPILAQKTYLASHSLGAVPSGTADALQEYYRLWAERGILAWDGPWWEAVGLFSSQIEGLLGAPPGTVVPMQNVTRAMAAVASCFDFDGPRRRIVMTDLEFTTSYPFWRQCERLGAEIVIVPSDDGVSVDPARLIEVLDERVLLVTTSHAYFRSGALQDLGALSKAAHAVEALVLGDGYQAAGTVPTDVLSLGVDFYVGGCHKWLCGGAGAGYLYVRQALIGALRPRITGWFGLAEPFSYEGGTSGGGRHPGIARFLGGTPNVPALYAAREGLRIVSEIGVEAIREVSAGLTAAIMEHASARGFSIRSPAHFASRNGMVCIQFDGAQEVSAGLCDRGIIVDWRPDCGMRVSPHFYNTQSDVERLFGVIDELV